MNTENNIGSGHDCLDAISCEAKHCVYNDNQDHCTAPHIKVGSQSASCANETACDTFRCK